MSQHLAASATDVSLGIDISKTRLDVHLHPHGTTARFPNDATGIAALIAWSTPQQPKRIIFEATGAYHRALERALAQAGLPAVKVNPLQARRFAQASGTRAKTDVIDAAMLARFGAVLCPDVAPVRDEALDALHELQAARKALIKDRIAALSRAQTLTLELLKRQNKARLKQIENQIKAIEQEMAQRCRRHEALQRRFEILASIPGIGAVSARAMLIEMPELGSLDAKQAASLAGLAPITRQSGAWRGKAFIQGGRAELRQALYMPALVAIHFNPDLKATYDALCDAGKPAKLAIVAVMRKIVVLANALLRQGRIWAPRQPAGTAIAASAG